MKQRLIDYFASLADRKWIYPALFSFSFLESILIPIPLEVVLIPLLLHASRRRATAFATTALAGYIAGATVGYFSAVYLFDQVSGWMLQTTEAMHYYDQAVSEMQQHGFAFLLTVGLTPIPSQIAMLAAGTTGYPFFIFITLMMFTRAIRYFGIAYIMWRWGEAGYRWLLAHKSTSKKVVGVLILVAIVYELLF